MFVKSNRGWLVLAHITYQGEHFDEYLGLRESRDNRRKGARITKMNGAFIPIDIDSVRLTCPAGYGPPEMRCRVVIGIFLTSPFTD